MTRIPILMSGEMVRATLREIQTPGTGKTQMRRVLTPNNTLFNGGKWSKLERQQVWDWSRAFVDPGPSPAGNSGPYLHLPWESGDADIFDTTSHRIYPKIQPGDLLWVKESWSGLYHFRNTPPAQRKSTSWGDQPIDRRELWFWADGGPDCLDWEPLRPSIHMPKWASRITLEVTEIRIERVQEICEADARAEGIERLKSGRGFYNPTQSKGAVRLGHYFDSATDAFASLWDSLNAKRGFGWDVNPWVIVIGFKPHLRNVGDMTDRGSK